MDNLSFHITDITANSIISHIIQIWFHLISVRESLKKS